MLSLANPRITDWSIIQAYRVLLGELPYLEDTLPQTQHRNPEEEYTKKEGLQRLSAEAKEVMNMILSTPAEIVDMLVTPKRRHFTKPRIALYLSTKGWSEDQIDHAFSEIGEWSDALE